MERISILAIALSCCIACDGSKNEATGDKDTLVMETDTIVQQSYSKETTTSTTAEKEIIYASDNYGFDVSDPYDFSLSAESIEKLLGKEAKTAVEEFEFIREDFNTDPTTEKLVEEDEDKAEEDFDTYTYTTITYKDTEISFYDYPGKHSSHITTPLLPLQNGIKIGMKRENFLQAMKFDDENSLKATVYEFGDDYGYMKISFRADTLYLIEVDYEEGD